MKASRRLSRPLAVHFVTPAYPPDVGGNATSAARLVHGLEAAGVRVRVHRAAELRAGEFGIDGSVLGRVGDGAPPLGPPPIVHAFHAFRSGGPLLPTLRRSRPPFVLSMAGTDVNLDAGDPAWVKIVCGACELADAVIVMHRAMGDRLERAVPSVAGKIRVIHPGVEAPRLDRTVEEEARALRRSWGAADGDIVFLLPAGIRAVKRPAFALEPLEALRAEGAPVRLVIVGGTIEADAGKALADALRGRPWAAWLEPVPFAKMAAYYLAADVALNTSLAEGLSNAVLESMACGRPVLASDIEGNRACIVDGETGLLFDDEQAFIAKARALVEDPRLRARLGERARNHVAEHFDPDREIEAHLDVYRSVACRDGAACVP